MSRLQFPAPRFVYHGDALNWLKVHQAEQRASVITSLPDLSEMSPMTVDQWRAWFVGAARAVLTWLPKDGCAIFFQTDIRYDHQWIDKSALLHEAAQESEAALIWHKIVCRNPPGSINQGRPGYAHMLCFSKGRVWTPVRPGPDVIADGGDKPWVRAMGVKACEVACRFVRDETVTDTIVDPFCGHGTALAVANNFGFKSVGIDLSAQRVRKSLLLKI